MYSTLLVRITVLCNKINHWGWVSARGELQSSQVREEHWVCQGGGCTIIVRGETYIATAKTAQRVPITVLRFWWSCGISNNTSSVTATKPATTGSKTFTTFICSKQWDHEHKHVRYDILLKSGEFSHLTSAQQHFHMRNEICLGYETYSAIPSSIYPFRGLWSH